MNKETLNKLKELAQKAETEVIRSHGWAGSVEMLDTLRTDEEYLTAASPAAILELIAMAERTTSPVSQMTEHKGGDQIQRPGDKAESNQGHKPVLIDNYQLLVRKVHPAPVEGTFTREEARAAVLAVAAQPQPVAEQGELPPLPTTVLYLGARQYTAEQMHAYARVAIAASQPEAKAAPAKAEANWTAEEAADFAANPSGLDESRMSLAARVAGMAIRKSVPDEALMFQIKRLQSLLTKPHRELIERAIQWHEAGREAQEVRRLVPSQVTDAATPWAIQQPQGKPNADCSGYPKSCPDNEGYGCACDPMNKASSGV